MSNRVSIGVPAIVLLVVGSLYCPNKFFPLYVVAQIAITYWVVLWMQKRC